MGAHPANPWFPLENLEKILPVLARNCWSVYLSCGGEALMHPQFEAALAIASKYLKKTDVTLVTNARLLTEERRKAILNSCITKIQASVHTLSPDLYSRLYGAPAGSMEKALESIEALIREKKGAAWPKVTITAIAMQSTINGLPEVARWAARIGADSLRIQKLIPLENSGLDPEIITLDNHTTAKFKEAARIMAGAGKFMDWPYQYGFNKAWSVLHGLALIRWNKPAFIISTLRKFLESKKNRGCWVAGNTIRIDSNGEILLCRRKAITLPNILENPGVDIQRVLARALHKFSFAQNPLCVSGCPYYFDTACGRAGHAVEND